MEYMYLQGAEDVLRAASAIREAANDMNRAADNINNSVAYLENVLSDFLYDFQNILENKNIK
jgi:hypothetical protein